MSDQKQRFKKYSLLLWGIAMLPILIFVIVLITAASGKMGYMPKVEDLENPKINLASQLISQDGQVLGSIYYKNQNRISVGYEQLPDHLVNALLATEDIRFEKHSGVDFRGLARAFVLRGVMRRESAGGGSTLTQQFAKLLFHEQAASSSERLKQKVMEWIIAVKLERTYTKKEIITLYFNQYDFLYNAVGIESAAKVYFNTTPDSLSIEQSAVLVGMAKNSVIYNPILHPEKSKMRRNTVLEQMVKYGYLSRQACDTLNTKPLETNFTRISHNVGMATYFREYIRRSMRASKPLRSEYGSYTRFKEDSLRWVEDPLYGWCNKNQKSNGEPYSLGKDGLKIYTTIDSRMQAYAESAVKKHLGGYLQPEFNKEKKGRSYAPYSKDLTKTERENILWNEIRKSERGRRLISRDTPKDSIYKIFNDSVDMKVFSWDGYVETRMTPLDSIVYYKHFLHTGFMAMEPHTGYVKAYVGGINFTEFKYDHVTQGKRQAGSTFKPYLYTLGMQEGYSPCEKVFVIPQSFVVNGEVWTPKTSASSKYLNTQQTLKWGLANSENYISAWLYSKCNPHEIAKLAYKMGIKSRIDPVPSVIYGPSDMSVEEMVSSYTTFVNGGIYKAPLYVTRIEDRYGNVLANFLPESHEAISENTAAKMISLLQGVANFGTAVRLRTKYKMTAQIAGKTGTTNNNSDGWFIGIVPKLVAGGWVGGDDRSIHFDNTSMGSGTNMALPIWAEFMLQVYEDEELGITQEDVFTMPEGFDPSFQQCEEELLPGEEPIDIMPSYVEY